MLRNEFHRCVRGKYFFFFFRIENTAFGYEADPNLLVFLFSSNSFYSHLSCTVLLLFVFFFTYTPEQLLYIQWERRQGDGKEKKGHAKAFSLLSLWSVLTCTSHAKWSVNISSNGGGPSSHAGMEMGTEGCAGSSAPSSSESAVGFQLGATQQANPSFSSFSSSSL